MVGSYPRPRWYRRTSYGQDLRELLMDAAWREEYEDTVKAVLNDQVTAGLDIVSDGELFEDDYYGSTGWPDYVVGRVAGRPPRREVRPMPGGLSRSPILQHLFEEGWPTPVLSGPVEHGPLRFAYLYELAARFSGDRPVKASFIDPQLAASFLQDRYYGSQPGSPAEALVMDLVEIYREELHDLAVAGCPIFQSDLPPFATLGMMGAPPERWDLAVRAFNRMVEDTGQMQIWMHYCWGRPFGQLARGEAGDFRPMFPRVFDANFHVLNIECGQCLGPEMELLEQVPADRGVAIGVIDHRALQVESADQVAVKIRRALQHTPAERLALTTYCGLGSTLPRTIAYFKLKALVDGAAIVRAELTGTRPELTPVEVGA
jgi:5-methyltetrahydropteroyltriglutamate--homocysteine methyltransferase